MKYFRTGMFFVVTLAACSPTEEFSVRYSGPQIDSGAAEAHQDCVDLDGDRYGEGCKRGGDCDDDEPLVNPARLELCNSIDDDCDGRVDEDYEIGEECDIHLGACTATGVTVCSDIASTHCVEGPETPLEACNGQDDDCDGDVDEGNPGGGAPCDAQGVGACAAGTFQCQSGALGCVPNTTPGSTDETCNGIDDDCDSMIDEAPGVDPNGGPGDPLNQDLVADCYGGPAGTLEAPDTECQAGQWTCTDGQFGACTGEVRPIADTCNGKDDDCDGMIDETCACDDQVDGSEPCYTGPVGTDANLPCRPGNRTCVGGEWGECIDEVLPGAEQCDGIDNDCDGIVDESDVDPALNVGVACTAGVGVCERGGTLTCVAGEPLLPPTCVVPGGVPDGFQEECDGLDNDCDGRTDETDIADPSCTEGEGACARVGVLTCDLDAGAFRCNVNAAEPAAEICDEVDNDCDGEVDEDFAVGTGCTVGVGACSRVGDLVCNFDGTAVCDVQPGGPTVEVCDTIDNDCDGAVDEGLGLGNACAEIGICIEGVLECAPGGALRCSSHPGGSDDRSGFETCDNQDNNCDGEIDEPYYDKGEVCSELCLGVPYDGVRVCRSDGSWTRCDPNAGQLPPDDNCDTIDDDCDDQIDEDAVCP